MKLIKDFEDFIEDEIEGAKAYVEKAIEIKQEYSELANMLLQMSNEEMGHMQNLHEGIQMLIKNYREEHGEPPEPMIAVYNYLHEKYIKKAKDVRILQDLYSM